MTESKFRFGWKPVAKVPCRDCGLALLKALFFYDQETVGPFCSDCGAAYLKKLLDAGRITSEQLIASASKEQLAKVYAGLVANGLVKDERVAALLKNPDLYEQLVEGLSKDEIAELGLVKPDDLV